LWAKSIAWALLSDAAFGLVKHPSEWPFNGAILPGYPTLHPLQEDFWRKFWKLYVEGEASRRAERPSPPIR